jgi:heptosyltransferase-2
MATREPHLVRITEPEPAPGAIKAQWAPEGVPLVHLAHKPMPMPARILVKAVNWLGDLVMSLPALRAIRDSFPEVKLAVLVRKELASFFDGMLWINEIIPYRLRGGAAGVLDRALIVNRIRSGHFDLAVLFPKSFQAALWVTLAGVPRRAGYLADRRGFMLTHTAAMRAEVERVHQAYHWMTMVGETIGAEGSVENYRLGVDGEAKDRMRAWLGERRARTARPLVALAPVAAYGPAKEWPAERYSLLVDILADRHRAECVLVGGIDDRARCEEIAGRSKSGALVAAGETTVGELVALLALCQGFAGNDSGCMHLAGALGLPTVAAFGSTNPARTGPLGWRTRIICRELECSPCLERTCRFGHYNCLRDIAAEEIAGALDEFGVFA